ncbi:MAG: methylated-DNA--[protein]-cysteine S-methyltransferase, partial [Euryarchaeota archaeon]|nr:methylated-DNA--[protein]-cysteine S-methyltransferase [Euryarchaeota archaeon]
MKYGTTITYSELARRIGSRAVRAVGGVLARNPVPIIIPCHRVVAKNGIG